jgi:hypothetical protein
MMHHASRKEAATVRYMLMVYEDESSWEALSAQERAASVDRHRAFAQELRRQGRFVAGEGLQPTTAATTVRHRGQELVVTDGPFAETKEQLGGFYLIEAPDLDQAIADAAAISSRFEELIEIRPVIGAAEP